MYILKFVHISLKYWQELTNNDFTLRNMSCPKPGRFWSVPTQMFIECLSPEAWSLQVGQLGYILLLMVRKSCQPVEVDKFAYPIIYQGFVCFIHPRWLFGIPAINSIYRAGFQQNLWTHAFGHDTFTPSTNGHDASSGEAWNTCPFSGVPIEITSVVWLFKRRLDHCFGHRLYSAPAIEERIWYWMPMDWRFTRLCCTLWLGENPRQSISRQKSITHAAMLRCYWFEIIWKKHVKYYMNEIYIHIYNYNDNVNDTLLQIYSYIHTYMYIYTYLFIYFWFINMYVDTCVHIT